MQIKKTDKNQPTTTEQLKDIAGIDLDNVTGGCAACGMGGACTMTMGGATSRARFGTR